MTKAARPRVFGDEQRFRASLKRHVESGQEILDQLEPMRPRLYSLPEERRLRDEILEIEWTARVERWRVRMWQLLRRYLGEAAEGLLPTATGNWPPRTGKPRHARGVEWVERWLRESLAELESLRDALGVRRNVTSVSPQPARFDELRAAALVDPAVIDAYAKEMVQTRTPKQLADAIGASKELVEATLRGALERLGEKWGPDDEVSALMKRWRRRVEEVAPPDEVGREALDQAQAHLANLIRFLSAWRNAYGRGHGRPRFPKGLSSRHARLAIDIAEAATRFIATTMDDLSLLPSARP